MAPFPVEALNGLISTKRVCHKEQEYGSGLRDSDWDAALRGNFYTPIIGPLSPLCAQSRICKRPTAPPVLTWFKLPHLLGLCRPAY